jgi:hypothetical protein
MERHVNKGYSAVDTGTLHDPRQAQVVNDDYVDQPAANTYAKPPRLFDPDGRTRWGLKRGNIDLNDRPVVNNPDGSVSTVRSASSEIGGNEVLYPTVAAPDEGTFGTSASQNPRIISGADAADMAERTGRNLGTFRTWQQADQYAEALHKMQEKRYVKGK